MEFLCPLLWIWSDCGSVCLFFFFLCVGRLWVWLQCMYCVQIYAHYSWIFVCAIPLCVCSLLWELVMKRIQMKVQTLLAAALWEWSTSVSSFEGFARNLQLLLPILARKSHTTLQARDTSLVPSPHVSAWIMFILQNIHLNYPPRGACWKFGYINFRKLWDCMGCWSIILEWSQWSFRGDVCSTNYPYWSKEEYIIYKECATGDQQADIKAHVHADAHELGST